VLSVSDKRLLTDDLRQQIVEVWAANIWQTASQVWERLAQQGVAVTERLVQEAGRQSGLMKIRARLKEQFIHGPEGLRPRDGYVTEQLFKLVEQLQAQVQVGQAAPREDTVDVTALRQITGVAEPAKTLEKPWPWLFQVEHPLCRGLRAGCSDSGHSWTTARCAVPTAAANTLPARAGRRAAKPIWMNAASARRSRSIATIARTRTALTRPLRTCRLA
jgi:hypothetical protein